MDWKTYPKNRKFVENEHCVVVVPDNFDPNKRKSMPLFCGVCQFAFCDREDEKTFELFSCCSRCADTWAYANKEKWILGWRPSTEQIQIMIEKRNFKNNVITFE